MALQAWKQPEELHDKCSALAVRATALIKYACGYSLESPAAAELTCWLSVLAALLRSLQGLTAAAVHLGPDPPPGVALVIKMARQAMRAVAAALCRIDCAGRELAMAGPSAQPAGCMPQELRACRQAATVLCTLSSAVAAPFRRLVSREPVQGDPGTDSRWGSVCERLGRDAASLLIWAGSPEEARGYVSLLASLPEPRGGGAGAMPPGFPEGVHVEWLRRCIR